MMQVSGLRVLFDVALAGEKMGRGKYRISPPFLRFFLFLPEELSLTAHKTAQEGIPERFGI